MNLGTLVLIVSSVFAQEAAVDRAPVETPPAQPAESTPVSSSNSGTLPQSDPSPVPAKPGALRPGKKVYREKEAEGSEARNKFTADPVVKSQYRFNGQALEVDTD